MKKFLLCLTFLFGSLLFFKPEFALAEKINSFDTSIVAHKNGLMDIEETINYDFESLERHGVYRYIPLYSKVGDLYRVIKIENVSILRDGVREKFETNKNKEQVYFKIGDKDRTITGPHHYVIKYIVKNGIGSNFPEYDEIYWNATGNDWTVPIEKSSIKFQTDFDVQVNELKCFTGIMGSVNSRCLVNDTNVISLESLNPGEGLTVVATYPKGTFPPSTLLKALPKTAGETIMGLIFGNFYIFWLVLNIILPAGIILWYQTNKNKKRFGKPVVNFEIPKDEKGDRLAPALAGTIDTAELERDDVVATLFDLAIRRYIKLEETKSTRKLRPDSVKQKITKLKNSTGLNSFENTLYDRLFEKGDEVYADDLKLDFYETFQEMEKKAFEALVQKKYFIKNPKYQRGFLFVLGLITIGTSNIILGIILILLARKLIGRTSVGDEIDFKIDGLKLFLKSMDRNYKWQAKNFYTVEQMIPYAMALGYIDKFMEQLKIVNPDYNPTWYSGYSGSFYGSYGGFFSSINSNITTSAPSSSSGFSGGSSGGGGGGGGGGSW